MRRKASMSGSTSTKSSATVRGFTAPSFSARLLPWVRVTVFSCGSLIGLPSAAVAFIALGDGERVAQPCGRDVFGSHGAQRLEHLEVMARAARGPELDARLERRAAGQLARHLARLDEVACGETEALARPGLHAGARLEPRL